MKTLKVLIIGLALLVIAAPVSAATITAFVKTGGDAAAPAPLLVVGGLGLGSLSYIDRTAVWEVLPAYLVGADYIQTENNDKNVGVTGEEYSVTLGSGGFLHVFVDRRLGAPSAANQMTWLTDSSVIAGGFALTGHVVLQDFGVQGDFDFDVWSVFAAAGTYDLGEQTGASFYGIAATPVPEPGTVAMLGLGLLGIIATFRARTRP